MAASSAPKKLGKHPWPVRLAKGSRRLEAPAHVEFTVGTSLNLLLAAEMEVPETWVADRPAAIVRQKRDDRLFLLPRNS